MRQEAIRCLENWPPQSPNLNIIEGLWSYLKDKVSENNPTQDELWEVAKVSWNQISDERFTVVCHTALRQSQTFVVATQFIRKLERFFYFMLFVSNFLNIHFGCIFCIFPGWPKTFVSPIT